MRDYKPSLRGREAAEKEMHWETSRRELIELGGRLDVGVKEEEVWCSGFWLEQLGWQSC